jgi:peptide/nickel transport system ATP-binding protein
LSYASAVVDVAEAVAVDPRPKITTIAGESGSGKSTLANLALDFIHPTVGQILYKGKEIGAIE